MESGQKGRMQTPYVPYCFILVHCPFKFLQFEWITLGLRSSTNWGLASSLKALIGTMRKPRPTFIEMKKGEGELTTMIQQLARFLEVICWKSLAYEVLSCCPTVSRCSLLQQGDPLVSFCGSFPSRGKLFISWFNLCRIFLKAKLYQMHQNLSNYCS